MSEEFVRFTPSTPGRSTIQKIFLESFPIHERVSLNPFIDNKDDSAALWALKVDGKIEGFITYLHRKDLVYIFYVAVSKNARGKGYGKKLMQFVVHKFPHARIFLNCEALYEGAKNPEERLGRINFYKGLGFCPMGKKGLWRGERFERMYLRDKVEDHELDHFWHSFDHLWAKEDRNVRVQDKDKLAKAASAAQSGSQSQANGQHS